MSLRLFLILLPVCAVAGFGAGYLGGAREGTPAAPPGPDADAARAALAATRALPAGAARRAARVAFLERYPASWLRHTWPQDEGAREADR